MKVYGYAKQYQYTGDGTLIIKTRIPAIHGPLNKSEYKGQKIRRYTEDNDLPWYPSLILPHLPNADEVVALVSINEASSSGFLIIGLTGGYGTNPNTDVEGLGDLSHG